MGIREQFHRVLKASDNNRPCSEAQAKVVASFFSRVVRKREDRLKLQSQIFGHPISSSYDLTRDEASALINFGFLRNWEIDPQFLEWVQKEYEAIHEASD